MPVSVTGRQLTALNSCSPLDAALTYAGLGWRVFPVAPVDPSSGCCGCRDGTACGQVGKHPLVRWADRATSDPAQIREWWGTWKPDANIGVATGQRSGLVVVDIDRQHDGLTTRQDLAARGLLFPATLAARTRSGGWHFFYQAPRWRVGNTEGELAGVGATPGIDVRGDGGYVIVAPSARPAPPVDGRGGRLARYRWVAQDQPITAAPVWVTPPKLQARRAAPTGTVTVTDASRRAEAALAGEIARLRGAGEGNRNRVLFQAAGNLFEIVNTGCLDEQRVRTELTAAAVAVGLGDKEVACTLDGQWRRKQRIVRAGWTRRPAGGGQARSGMRMRSQPLGDRPGYQQGWGR